MIEIKKVVRCTEAAMGYSPPKIYGLAYVDYCCALLIFYPFPLNHLVKFFRNLWFRIRDVSIENEGWKALEDIIQKIEKFERTKEDLVKRSFSCGYNNGWIELEEKLEKEMPELKFEKQDPFKLAKGGWAVPYEKLKELLGEE